MQALRLGRGRSGRRLRARLLRTDRLHVQRYDRAVRVRAGHGRGDNWGDCEVFHGSITITGNVNAGLTDLLGMSQLRKVCGTVTIQNLDMLSLEGLHNLELVTGPLRSANHLSSFETSSVRLTDRYVRRRAQDREQRVLVPGRTGVHHVARRAAEPEVRRHFVCSGELPPLRPRRPRRAPSGPGRVYAPTATAVRGLLPGSGISLRRHVQHLREQLSSQNPEPSG